MAAPSGQSSPGESASASAATLPSISAAFVVKFDDRKGYTLAWQESIDELDIEGVVEFKSMPSGLHNVNEDVVYFVHEDYAGISAVLNIEDLEAARKARVIAVGVLVPLEHGRMGKSWLHAEGLKELAKKQIHKDDDYAAMEEFWSEHKVSATPGGEEPAGNSSKGEFRIDTNLDSKPNGYRRIRSMSIGTGHVSSDYVLPAHHPALAIPELLRLFGPLTFPLVRAALLRKRILFLGEAPVEKTCNFVYNLSILSSLPRPITTLLPNLNPTNFRLRPLLNIGVSDIGMLEAESKSPAGWIACTTDDVICTKPDLFDLLVILPNAVPSDTDPRKYPKMYLSSPELSRARPKYGLRASQRDAKRFATLWKGLQRIPRSNKQQEPADTSAIASSSETSTDPQQTDDPAETASIASSASSTISLKSVVEPQSWSQIAYTSLVWWASAGDKRSGLTEAEDNENEQDIALLTGEDLGEVDDGTDDEAKTREVAVVQYFQRLSNLMFTAASEAIRRSDAYRDDNADDHPQSQQQEQDEDGQALLPQQEEGNGTSGGSKVEITQDDVQNMGLDVWSQFDRTFVEELVKFWWDRDVDVQTGRIECCGVRIL